MEVAALLRDPTTILPTDDGASAPARNLEESVTSVRQVEGRTRVNWGGYVVAGVNHLQTPPGFFAEVSGRALQPVPPHFGEPAKGTRLRVGWVRRPLASSSYRWLSPVFESGVSMSSEVASGSRMERSTCSRADCDLVLVRVARRRRRR